MMERNLAKVSGKFLTWLQESGRRLTDGQSPTRLMVLEEHFDGEAATEKVGVRPILFWWSKYIERRAFPLPSWAKILGSGVFI